jgi:hypothetical protein
LRVAALVLQWNFQASMTDQTKKGTMFSIYSVIPLKPNASWGNLFQDEKLLPFFFGLHQTVRQDTRLSQNTLACLVQLSTLTGPAINNRASNYKNKDVMPLDTYLRRFCTGLMDLFKE